MRSHSVHGHVVAVVVQDMEHVCQHTHLREGLPAETGEPTVLRAGLKKAALARAHRHCLMGINIIHTLQFGVRLFPGPFLGGLLDGWLSLLALSHLAEVHTLGQVSHVLRETRTPARTQDGNSLPLCRAF